MSNTIALRTPFTADQQREVNAPQTAVQIPKPAIELAQSITRKASQQTYATIHLLADRSHAAAAYLAYAYFRWVDDILDDHLESKAERLAFLQRQQMIVDRCTRGARPNDLCAEERMVAELIGAAGEQQSGVAIYVREMMAVMAFDAERKGRTVNAVELQEYTHSLATSVTEALHHCIGHDDYAPFSAARYDAVTAAHITHMLRDAVEDTANGYYNVPQEYLQWHGIAPDDFDSPAYRAWVKSRVKLARQLFASGCAQIARVENARCRLAGYAYITRFERVLDLIEKDDYFLRPAYPERKSKRAALTMASKALGQSLLVR